MDGIQHFYNNFQYLKILIINSGYYSYDLSCLVALEIFRYIGNYFIKKSNSQVNLGFPKRHLEGMENLSSLNTVEYSGELIMKSFNNNNAHHSSSNNNQQVGPQNILNGNEFQGNLKYFYFSENERIHQITTFNHLEIIKFKNLQQVYSISYLTNIHYLEIDNCEKLEEFHHCNNIYHVQIHFCPILSQLNELINIRTLLFHSCPGVWDFTNEIIECSKICIDEIPSFMMEGDCQILPLNKDLDWIKFPSLDSVTDFLY